MAFESIKAMSPLKRRFTAAALGFGMECLCLATQSPVMPLLTLVAAGVLISKLSHSGGDFAKNMGSYMAGFLAPLALLVGAMVIAAGTMDQDSHLVPQQPASEIQERVNVPAYPPAIKVAI